MPTAAATGARGDGATDDAAAINWALQAANDSNAELVFGPKTYAVGATLKKGEGMRVFSRPGATLRALWPGLTGIEHEAGGHPRPTRCPPSSGSPQGFTSWMSA